MRCPYLVLTINFRLTKRMLDQPRKSIFRYLEILNLSLRYFVQFLFIPTLGYFLYIIRKIPKVYHFKPLYVKHENFYFNHFYYKITTLLPQYYYKNTTKLPLSNFCQK